MMEVTEKQMFLFRSNVNGSPFEFGRVGTSRQEAATSLANDLQKFVDELREVTKSG
jgi:hypothetical protein